MRDSEIAKKDTQVSASYPNSSCVNDRPSDRGETVQSRLEKEITKMKKAWQNTREIMTKHSSKQKLSNKKL